MSYLITPFIPQNTQEEVQIINSSLAAGSMSQQTAAEEHPNTAADEVDRLRADEERKEAMEIRAEERAAEQQITSQMGIEQTDPNPQDGRFKNNPKNKKS